MADMVTVQELENAKIDARTIGESVNENKIVTPRYGAPFKSMPMIAEEMQSVIGTIIGGGVPASIVLDSSGKTQQDINNQRIRTPLDLFSIGDGILRPVSDLYTIGSLAYNPKFTDLSSVQAVLTAATAATDPLDWCAIQTLINQVPTKQHVIYLSDKYYHIGGESLLVKQPIVMFGTGNLGIGGSLINYNGSGSVFILKKDNFDSSDYSKWIYGASLTNFGIRGLGGNAQKAIELWGCSECCFDKLTIGGTSQSKFVTAIELNRCAINTFNGMVASYNDVMYDFKVDPTSRFKTNAATYIIGGDYYANKTMFKCNSVSGLSIENAWIESCELILDFDDTVSELECENIIITGNNFVMNTPTTKQIVSLKNLAGKQSRVLNCSIYENVFRYTDPVSNVLTPFNFSALSSNSYNTFNFLIHDNNYYGKAASLTISDSLKVNLRMKDNRNFDSTYKNVIPDSAPSSIFTGAEIHSRNDSISFGRSQKTRGSATVIIDDQGGSGSSLAIYQKTGAFPPLLNLYNSAGTLISSLNVDGSASLSYLKLAVNTLRNLNGAPSSGSYVVGDRILNNEPSITKPVTEWTCTISSPLTWQQSAHLVYKGTTAQRPVLTLKEQGVQYLDTTLNANGKPIWWSGSVWVDSTGATV